MLVAKVKICGITNYEDALAAMEMGADILGFNFYPKSPRYIEPERAGRIVGKLPAFVDLAGIFVNSPADEIRSIVDVCNLDWIQLHGDENPGFCREFAYDGIKTMKAIRVKDKTDIARAQEYHTDAILLDAFDPSRYGGTGTAFDWNGSARACASSAACQRGCE